ncbi:hypothetical protein E2C01_032240 [Portunus trituberculatus]|uniref:Uncharacterized protein n=1 Tax=Portunus trituberculatus TaxID=210409 RepID=A0A5B7EZT4_PORTR|nr:hypothetical protein [Portunus trituberculatus]
MKGFTPLECAATHMRTLALRTRTHAKVLHIERRLVTRGPDHRTPLESALCRSAHSAGSNTNNTTLDWPRKKTLDTRPAKEKQHSTLN